MSGLLCLYIYNTFKTSWCQQLFSLLDYRIVGNIVFVFGSYDFVVVATEQDRLLLESKLAFQLGIFNILFSFFFGAESCQDSFDFFAAPAPAAANVFIFFVPAY